MKLLLIILLLVNLHISFSFKFLRFKRDGDLLSELTKVVQNIAAPLTGNNNKPTVVDPSFNSGPGSGTNAQQPRSEAKPQPQSIGEVIGYCHESPQMCEYLACMGGNFKNNDNLKAGSKVLGDPELRSAVANDPAILKEACNKAGLNENGCANFKAFLQLAEKVDPKSLHTGDEPREKRSPKDDDYDSHGNTNPKSPSSSSSGSSKSSSSSSSGSNSNRPPGKSSGSDYDYEHSHTSSKSGHVESGHNGNSQGQGSSSNKQQDCEAAMRRQNNANNFNNPNPHSNAPIKSRAKARRGGGRR